MNKTPTYEIVNIILRRGNQPGLITEWFGGMKAWADANRGTDATALRTWLGIVKPRPFYTAGELAKIWPALQLTLGLQKRLVPEPSANRLENELRFHRLPTLRNSNGTDMFLVPGTRDKRRYFVVEHCHKWHSQELSQEEFANVLFN